MKLIGALLMLVAICDGGWRDTFRPSVEPSCARCPWGRDPRTALLDFEQTVSAMKVMERPYLVLYRYRLKLASSDDPRIPLVEELIAKENKKIELWEGQVRAEKDWCRAHGYGNKYEGAGATLKEEGQ